MSRLDIGDRNQFEKVENDKEFYELYKKELNRVAIGRSYRASLQ